MKNLAPVLGAVLLLTIMVSCKKDINQGASTDAGPKPLIGMMQHTQSDSFQRAMLKGAQETAVALGYDLVDASANDDPVKELEIIGAYATTQSELQKALSFIDSGVLKPWISEVLPLAEAWRAHQMLEERAVAGRLVLMPGH